MLPLHHLCWLQRRESNPHLSAYEAAALPLSYAAVDSRAGVAPAISGFADQRLADLATWRFGGDVEN